MTKTLVVVDMQKDFVDGALGTPEAVAILPAVCEYIRDFSGDIVVTMDTHGENYMETAEGEKLPVPHCIKGTPGWEIHAKVKEALSEKSHTVVEKGTFGSVHLPEIIGEDYEGEIILLGLCTDICVVSNALLLKAHFPENKIAVVASCCAGVTPESHKAALSTMASCQIEVQ